MPSEVNGVVSVDCRVVISDGLYKCITPLHRGVLRVLAFFIFARRVSRKRVRAWRASAGAARGIVSDVEFLLYTPRPPLK